MNDHAANTNGIRGINNAPRAVTEQGAADAPSQAGPIHGEPGQDRHRNGLRHVTSKSARRMSGADGTGGKSVIPKHPMFVTGHESPGGTADLIGARPAL